MRLGPSWWRAIARTGGYMISVDAITALRRFGYGARPGDARNVDDDPRGWVSDQTTQPRAALITSGTLMDSAAVTAELVLYRRKRKKILAAAKDDSDRPMEALERKIGPPRAPFHYRQEMLARFDRAATSDTPFVERLVAFWSNHFCVSAKKGGRVSVAAGAYEREAIRPHVLGRFEDMLRASVQHPAMLLYLDNEKSFGPNSPAGRETGRGLNENLAREILELHTLGVNGGYSQTDVTNFAKIITGWSVGKPLSRQGAVFRFFAKRHEPGAIEVMGRRYGQRGVAQGEAVLGEIARHPSTARFVAGKFARHFIGDDVSQALLDQLARTFLDTDGDLAELSRALVAADEAWSAPVRKLLPPYDFLVAVSRATGWAPNDQDFNKAVRTLGQPIWAPPSPAGWPDEDDAWVTPDGLLERLDFAQKVAEEHASQIDVPALGEDILGPLLDEHSHRVIARAEDRRQALALLLMSSAFQRR